MLTGKIEYQAPNSQPDQFFGIIKLRKDPKIDKLTIENFLPRGSVIINTEWYYHIYFLIYSYYYFLIIIINIIGYMDQQCILELIVKFIKDLIISYIIRLLLREL